MTLLWLWLVEVALGCCFITRPGHVDEVEDRHLCPFVFAHFELVTGFNLHSENDVCSLIRTTVLLLSVLRYTRSCVQHLLDIIHAQDLDDLEALNY